MASVKDHESDIENISNCNEYLLPKSSASNRNEKRGVTHRRSYDRNDHRLRNLEEDSTDRKNEVDAEKKNKSKRKNKKSKSSDASEYILKHEEESGVSQITEEFGNAHLETVEDKVQEPKNLVLIEDNTDSECLIPSVTLSKLINEDRKDGSLNESVSEVNKSFFEYEDGSLSEEHDPSSFKPNTLGIKYNVSEKDAKVCNTSKKQLPVSGEDNLSKGGEPDAQTAQDPDCLVDNQIKNVEVASQIQDVSNVETGKKEPVEITEKYEAMDSNGLVDEQSKDSALVSKNPEVQNNVTGTELSMDNATTEVSVDNASTNTEVSVQNVATVTEGSVDNAATSTEVSVENAATSTEGSVDNAATSTEVTVENAATSTEVTVENAATSTEVTVENAATSTEVTVENAATSTEVSNEVAATSIEVSDEDKVTIDQNLSVNFSCRSLKEATQIISQYLNSDEYKKKLVNIDDIVKKLTSVDLLAPDFSTEELSPEEVKVLKESDNLQFATKRKSKVSEMDEETEDHQATSKKCKLSSVLDRPFKLQGWESCCLEEQFRIAFEETSCGQDESSQKDKEYKFPVTTGEEHPRTYKLCKHQIAKIDAMVASAMSLDNYTSLPLAETDNSSEVVANEYFQDSLNCEDQPNVPRSSRAGNQTLKHKNKSSRRKKVRAYKIKWYSYFGFDRALNSIKNFLLCVSFTGSLMFAITISKVLGIDFPVQKLRNSQNALQEFPTL